MEDKTKLERYANNKQAGLTHYGALLAFPLGQRTMTSQILSQKMRDMYAAEKILAGNGANVKTARLEDWPLLTFAKEVDESADT